MTRLRKVVGAIGALALVGLCLIGLAVPSTSSAYIAKITNSTNTAAAATYFTCAAAENADRSNGAIFQWYLDEASNSTTAADHSNNGILGALGIGSDTGTYRGTMTTATTPAPLACPRDTGGAYVLNGTSSYVSSNFTSANPTAYSVEVWFKTTVAGGKLIGLGNVQIGASSQYDRHLYIDSTGKLVFGSYNNGFQTISTTGNVTDGKWHHAVGTQSTTGGMILYLDGSVAATAPAFTVSQVTTGYWHVGYDSLSGWPNAPANLFFTGQMRFAAAYSVVLTPTQVKNHWAAGQ